jgi:hypothetical protein
MTTKMNLMAELNSNHRELTFPYPAEKQNAHQLTRKEAAINLAETLLLKSKELESLTPNTDVVTNSYGGINNESTLAILLGEYTPRNIAQEFREEVGLTFYDGDSFPGVNELLRQALSPRKRIAAVHSDDIHCPEGKKSRLSITDHEIIQFFRKETIQIENNCESLTTSASHEDCDDSSACSMLTDSSWADLSLEVTSADSHDQEVEHTLKRLEEAMMKSIDSQKSLQEWDKASGLPKSHCQTMVNTSRSREQLQSGMVLQKWNGVPLLNLPGAKVKIIRRVFRGKKVVEVEGL